MIDDKGISVKLKYIFCVVTLFVALVIYTGERCEGGNLHNVTMSEWCLASYQNRLETSSDLIAACKLAKDKKQLTERSEELEAYMTTVAKDSNCKNQTVKEVAVMGMILLGFKDQKN